VLDDQLEMCVKELVEPLRKRVLREGLEVEKREVENREVEKREVEKVSASN
jgi:hypothetical protein